MKDYSEVRIPALSAALRAVIAGLEAQREADCERIRRVILETVPDYRSVVDQGASRELRDTANLNLQLWYQALLSGKPPLETDTDSIRELSAHRVHQGISLTGLLQAYRVGSSAIWGVMLDAVADRPELHRELLFDVSPYLLAHFDRVARDIALAYSTELNRTARWRDRLRSEIWNIVRNRPDDTEGFRRNTEALGLDPALPYCAVALKLAQFPSLSASLEPVLDQIIDGAARIFEVNRRRLFRVLHADCLVLLLPLPGPARPLDFDHRLFELAERVRARTVNVAAVGIGLPGAGAVGWGVSVEQAMKALQQPAGRGDTRIHRYSDIVLDDAVGRSDNAARFFDSLVECLAQEPNLLETLAAYFAHRQHRKATAAALHVHPNTLDYRLARVEAVLGAKLDDAGWVAKLHTALSRAQCLPRCE